MARSTSGTSSLHAHRPLERFSRPTNRQAWDEVAQKEPPSPSVGDYESALTAGLSVKV